ncbi:hypothetical protein [Hyphomonas sp.]|uniref:hypothetical protein n=1 Tax=Hyphomonas sp. TaxID=87 RepID=UPI0025B94E6E|nr:hypothetical protein [Hyphomonas sp.]
MGIGIADIQCAEDLSCIFEEGVCNSPADAPGTCTRTPAVCIGAYLPVCGCNGET